MKIVIVLVFILVLCGPSTANVRRRGPKPARRRPNLFQTQVAFEKRVEELWEAINEIKQDRSGVHIYFQDREHRHNDVQPIDHNAHDQQIGIAGHAHDEHHRDHEFDMDHEDHDHGDHDHDIVHDHDHDEERRHHSHYPNATEVHVRMELHSDRSPDDHVCADEHAFYHKEDSKDIHAQCQVMPNQNKMPEGFTNRIMGPIYFYQAENNYTIHVTINVTGCPSDSQHGFHVHEFGDMLGCCDSLGSHYNPMGTVHGAPDNEERHEGDFGNLNCENGKIESEIHVTGSLRGMIGRSIVLHQRADDMGEGESEASKLSGNAGGRVACCVIGWANPEKHIDHEHVRHEKGEHGHPQSGHHDDHKGHGHHHGHHHHDRHDHHDRHNHHEKGDIFDFGDIQPIS